MIPKDTLEAICSLLPSDRISFKGSEVPALNKVLSDVQAELNRRQVQARATPVKSESQDTGPS